MKYTVLLTLLFFSFSVHSADNKNRISSVENLLAASIDKNLFSIKNDKSKPHLIRVELDNSLNEEYKNSLHLWLVDASKTNPMLKNIFITRKAKAPIFTKSNILDVSIPILALLMFLFLALKLLSKKDSSQPDEIYEDLLTQKIENNVENIMTKPSRTIDYL